MMIDKLPTMVRVLAFDIEIVDWKPHGARNKFGEFSALENIIRIDFSTDKINVVDTLIHEINHAIFWAYGIHDEDKEERTVAILSSAWVQVFRDNLWILSFIGGKLEGAGDLKDIDFPLKTGNCPKIPDSSTRDNLSPVVKDSLTAEKSEGDKLRVRAVLLCKDKYFQEFSWNEADLNGFNINLSSSPEDVARSPEDVARNYIYRLCNIKSRSELTTNLDAQKLFRDLDRKFNDWQFENRYADNLERG